MKPQVSEEAEPNCSRISHKKMATFWAPQLLYKLGSRRGKKCIFLNSCKRLPRTETQTERQILGEVMGSGSAERTLRSQKPQIQVPLHIQELNPSLPGDFGSMDLSSAALDAEVSLGKEPEAGDLQAPPGDCRVQALIQGLVF